MTRRVNLSAIILCLAIALSGSLAAQDVGLTPSEEDVRSTIKEPAYSPYAGRNFPTEVFWGDTHVHTNNSLDARG